MRPNGEELLRGLQGSLATYILPELPSAYARSELMITTALLGIVAAQWDDAAQRLVDGNAALRALARRGADAIAGVDAGLAAELRALAQEADPSVRLSDLSAANDRLRAALGRLGVLLLERDAPALAELRAAVFDHLRQEAEARSLSLLGPRADG